MAKQSAAQREYMRDVRTCNSINYSARTTMPRCLVNIAIICKTMKYNELGGNPNSPEAKRVTAINLGLLIFTVAFEVLVLTMKITAFAFTLGKPQRRSRRRW